MSATNNGTVPTRGDAGAAQAGAGIAIAIVTFQTQAFIDTTGEVSAASLLVSADSTDTVTTVGSASQGGAEANDEPGARTEDNAQNSDGELAPWPGPSRSPSWTATQRRTSAGPPQSR